MQGNSTIDKHSEGSNLNEVIGQYTRHWKWFVLAIIVALIGVQIYLRYATPIYSSQASILLKNESVGSSFSELSALEDLGFFSGRSSKKLFDELEILKSRRLMEQVVSELGINVRYFTAGNVKEVEKYKDGIQLYFLEKEAIYNIHRVVELKIEPSENGMFTIKYGSLVSEESYKLGETIDIGFGKFIVVPIDDSYKDSGAYQIKETIVKISPVKAIASYYANKLVVVPKAKSSNALSLQIADPVMRKSRDILDTLISKYNQDRSADRNQIAISTADFIAKRLTIISEELDSVETTKEQFKRINRITDIDSEAALFVQSTNEYRKKALELETSIELSQDLLNELRATNSLKRFLPVNILGDNVGNTSGEITVYNELIKQRNNLLKTSTEKNPIVIEITDALQNQRVVIESSLKNTLSALRLEKTNLSRENSQFQSKISGVPTLEKESRGIIRQQEIKEQLYLYLLQKREETAISMAIQASNAKVIDQATSQFKPIFPKPGIIRLGSILLGFLVVFGSIYVYNLLDTKIHSRLEVEQLTSTPILGELPFVAREESEVIQIHDRSILAESFRILRTNLDYFTRTKEGKKNNIVYVTSTVKGEGKTFVAFNLLLTLASTGKKVILVGADIRNPQLHRYMDLQSSNLGLSEYLYDDTVMKEDVISTDKINGQSIDVILSGRIPPNPAELLLSSRFDNIINEVGAIYDFVIVDTAPTMQVTDTLLISKYADVTLFVTRADYTNKRLLQYSQDLAREGKLNKLAYIVNGVKSTNFGYGAKYGYGYGNEEEGLIQRLKKIFS